MYGYVNLRAMYLQFIVVSSEELESEETEPGRSKDSSSEELCSEEKESGRSNISSQTHKMYSMMHIYVV